MIMRKVTSDDPYITKSGDKGERQSRSAEIAPTDEDGEFGGQRRRREKKKREALVL